METMDIDALIAKGRAAFDNVQPVDAPVTFGDEAAAVRFWPMTSGEWLALTKDRPARTQNVRDHNLGYDLDAVVRDYPKVFLVQGDDVVNVWTPVDPKDPDHKKWHDLYDVLSVEDKRTLALALWGINEWEHQKRSAKAGKASAGGRKKKPS